MAYGFKLKLIINWNELVKSSQNQSISAEASPKQKITIKRLDRHRFNREQSKRAGSLAEVTECIFRLKVDLTPYIDEYRFNFDGAYDEHATN